MPANIIFSLTPSFVDNSFKFCNSDPGIAVGSGTDALHLAYLLAGIGPGDEVIVPSMTFVASANAVTYVGAKPIFVDSHESTWCVNTQSIEELITPNTRAIMVDAWVPSERQLHFHFMATRF